MIHWEPSYETLICFLSSWAKFEVPTYRRMTKFCFSECGLEAESTQFYKELELFWISDKVTLMMNSSSALERSNLTSQAGTNLQWEINEGERGFFATGTLPNLGPIYCSPESVALPHQKQLLDRNVVLMMKDLFAARACSKLALVGRQNQYKFKLQLKELHNFYRHGDFRLAKHGNQFFKAVKLVEPMANLRFIQLCQKFWPNVKISGDLNIRQNRDSNTQEGHIDIERFFKVVLEESCLETVLLFYGSFRHWGHPFIDYEAGLKKLFDRVHEIKNIDPAYANLWQAILLLGFSQPRLANRKDGSLISHKWTGTTHSISTSCKTHGPQKQK